MSGKPVYNRDGLSISNPLGQLTIHS